MQEQEESLFLSLRLILAASMCFNNTKLYLLFTLEIKNGMYILILKIETIY